MSAAAERLSAYPKIGLWVLKENPRAIRFYERHGFHLTDRKKRVDDTNEYLILMEK